jgi:hypothetical protein
MYREKIDAELRILQTALIVSFVWYAALGSSFALAEGQGSSFGNLERKIATFDPGGKYITRPIERKFPSLSLNGTYYFWSDTLLSGTDSVGFRERDFHLLQMQNLFEVDISYRISRGFQITSISHFLYDAVYDIEDADGLYAYKVDRAFEYYNDFNRIGRELYVSYRTPRLDLVVGKQQIAWGKMDGRFIDVINSMDFRESVQLETSDFELRRLPMWMVNFTYYFKGMSLNLLWIPDFESNLIPSYGAPWSSPLLPPDDATARSNDALLNGNTNAAGDLVLALREPQWDHISDSQVAGRLDSAIGALTWGVIYYYAWDRNASQSVVGRFDDGGRSQLILQPAYERLHHFGVTLDYAWVQSSVPLVGTLPIVFRLEALYTTDVPMADVRRLAAARAGTPSSGQSEHDTLRAALAFEFAFPANVSVIFQPSLFYTFTWDEGLGGGFGGAVGDEWNFLPVFFIERPIRATRDRLNLSATITPLISGPGRGFQGIKTKLIAGYEVSQYIQASLIFTAYEGGDRDDLYGQFDDWDNIGIELRYEF